MLAQSVYLVVSELKTRKEHSNHLPLLRHQTAAGRVPQASSKVEPKHGTSLASGLPASSSQTISRSISLSPRRKCLNALRDIACSGQVVALVGVTAPFPSTRAPLRALVSAPSTHASHHRIAAHFTLSHQRGLKSPTSTLNPAALSRQKTPPEYLCPPMTAAHFWKAKMRTHLVPRTCQRRNSCYPP